MIIRERKKPQNLAAYMLLYISYENHNKAKYCNILELMKHVQRKFTFLHDYCTVKLYMRSLLWTFMTDYRQLLKKWWKSHVKLLITQKADGSYTYCIINYWLPVNLKKKKTLHFIINAFSKWPYCKRNCFKQYLKFLLWMYCTVNNPIVYKELLCLL